MQKLLEEKRAKRDPLAVHIFISRRHYGSAADSKSGKHKARTALLSWKSACALGYRGNLHPWEKLMGAMPKR